MESQLINAASSIQAAWRSYYTRKCILQTRREYEEIAKEIERGLNETYAHVTVVWPRRTLCCPRFIAPVSSVDSGSRVTTSQRNNGIQMLKNNNHLSAPQQNEEETSLVPNCLLVGDQVTEHHQKSKEVEEPSSSNQDLRHRLNSLVPPFYDDIAAASDSTETIHGDQDKTKTITSNNNKINYNNNNCRHDELDDNNKSTPNHVAAKHSNIDNVEPVVTDSVCYSPGNDNVSGVCARKTRDDPPSATGNGVLTDSWMSDFESTRIDSPLPPQLSHERNAESVQKELLLELIWLQQAIQSRKVYLRMKNSSNM